jgi:hypothetical protein
MKAHSSAVSSPKMRMSDMHIPQGNINVLIIVALQQ